MKNHFILLLVVTFSLVSVVSCERTSETVVATDNDTYSVAYDFKGVNFVKNTNHLYEYYRAFATPLYSGDVLLVYRQSGSNNGNPVWQLLPKTYFFDQGDMDYTFDFTKNDFQLYANANFDLSAQNVAFNSSYLYNQTFRIVIVPAGSGGTIIGKSAVNYNDYNAVIKYYKIDESKIKSL